MSIPTQDGDFNTYIKLAIPYLQANDARLGVSGPNVNEMVGKLNDWNILYPKTQDDTRVTPVLINEKNDLRDEIEDLLREVFDDIPESALTDADRGKLKLPKRDDVGTPRPAITTVPFVNLLSRSSATIQVRCRVEEDSNRASRHEHADVIELCYLIGGEDDAPASPDECNKTITFKRALHRIKLDIADARKTFYSFTRWKNTSDDSKSSGWSRLESAVITF
jgi:hypothetical protein